MPSDHPTEDILEKIVVVETPIKPTRGKMQALSALPSLLIIGLAVSLLAGLAVSGYRTISDAYPYQQFRY